MWMICFQNFRNFLGSDFSDLTLYWKADQFPLHHPILTRICHTLFWWSQAPCLSSWNINKLNYIIWLYDQIFRYFFHVFWKYYINDKRYDVNLQYREAFIPIISLRKFPNTIKIFISKCTHFEFDYLIAVFMNKTF